MPDKPKYRATATTDVKSYVPATFDELAGGPRRSSATTEPSGSTTSSSERPDRTSSRPTPLQQHRPPMPP
jgi:hypothetical protein